MKLSILIIELKKVLEEFPDDPLVDIDLKLDADNYLNTSYVVEDNIIRIQ